MKARKNRQKIFSAVFRTAVMLSAVITAAAALLVLVYILYNGIPGLTLKGMFSWQYDLSLIHIYSQHKVPQIKEDERDDKDKSGGSPHM